MIIIFNVIVMTINIAITIIIIFITTDITVTITIIFITINITVTVIIVIFSDGPWSPTASICLPAQAYAEAHQVPASSQGDHGDDDGDDQHPHGDDARF